MLRLLVSAGLAAALIIPSAVEAANTHRHKRYVAHYGHVWRGAPAHLYGRSNGYRGYGAYDGYPGYGGYIGPNAYTSGPRWASPNQCFEDLGYGRYESCDW